MLVVSFLYFFAPVFNSISPIFDLIFAVSIFLCLFSKVSLLKSSYCLVFLCLVFVSLYSVVTIFFQDGTLLGHYLQQALGPIRIYVTLIGGLGLALLCYNRGYNDQDVLCLIIKAAAVHAVIMLVQLASPEFKDFIYSYTVNPEVLQMDIYNYEYYYRMGGLSGGFGSAILSVSMALPILFLPQVLMRKPIGYKAFYLILAVVIFSSVVISGRTGVIILLFLFPLSILLHINSAYGLYKSLSYLIWTAFLGAVLLVTLIGTVLGMEETSPLFYSVRRSLETLINFYQGDFEDRTLSTLARYIVFPNDFIVWVFGDGEHLVKTQFDRTLASDIGYIRNIWSLGILVSLVYWFPYLYLLFVSFIKYKNPLAINLFIVCLVTLILHAKEDVMYSRILCSYLGITLALYILNRKSLDSVNLFPRRRLCSFGKLL